MLHKFVPMPQTMKRPSAQAAVDEECDKLEKIPAWDKTKVRNKSDVIDEVRKEGKSVLRFIDGSLSFGECRIGGKAPKNTKVELYFEATL